MPTLKGVRLAGEQSSTVELGEKKVISRYVLEYLVMADNASQGPIAIRSTLGVPIVGLSTYTFNGESDTLAICKRKVPRRDTKNPLIWYVRCEFDDDPTSQAESNEQDQGPAVDRSPIMTWTAEYGEEILEKDFSDPRKDVVTPVGHQYDPPLTRRVIYPVCIIERYQTTFTPTTILTYTDHSNQDPFMGAPAGAAVMAEIGASQVVEDAVKLWRVSYRIRFSVQPDGFTQMPLNQDYQYKGPYVSGGAPLLDFPNGKLGNLLLDGKPAPEGTRTYGGADGLGFKPYPKADFDALNLV
ncbi:MAG: hypothetical protein U0930_03555 [Pirellulales bacterium]